MNVFEKIVIGFVCLCLGGGVVFGLMYSFQKQDEIYRVHNQEMNVPVDHRGLDQ